MLTGNVNLKLKTRIDRMDELIEKGMRSLAEDRELMARIAHRNGFDWILNEIRRLN